MRQLLTEAVVLSLLGTALGVMLAQLAIGVTLPLVPQFALPRLGEALRDHDATEAWLAESARAAA